MWLLLAALTHQSLPSPRLPRTPPSAPLVPVERPPAAPDRGALLPPAAPSPWPHLAPQRQCQQPLQSRVCASHGQPRPQGQTLGTAGLLLFGLCLLPSTLATVLMHTFRGSQSCGVLRVSVHMAEVAGSPTCTACGARRLLLLQPGLHRSHRKVLSSLRGRRQAAEPPAPTSRASAPDSSRLLPRPCANQGTCEFRPLGKGALGGEHRVGAGPAAAGVGVCFLHQVLACSFTMSRQNKNQPARAASVLKMQMKLPSREATQLPSSALEEMGLRLRRGGGS